jgi:regulatory protein
MDKARFNKWGRVKIRLKLKQLGLEDSIINSAIEQNLLVFKTDELEDILRKKWNSLKQGESNLSKKQKVLRYALSKGFEWGEIIPVLDKLG